MGLALCKPYHDLDPSLFEVEPQRDQGCPIFLDALGQFEDFALVEEQSPLPFGVVVEAVAVIVGSDVNIEEPGFSLVYFGIGVGKGYLAGSAAFYLGTCKFKAALDCFQYMVVVAGLLVAGQGGFLFTVVLCGGHRSPCLLSEETFCTGDKGIHQRMVFEAFHGFPVLLKECLLLAREILGNLHEDFDVLVAAQTAAQGRHALAFYAENRTVLCAFGYFEFRISSDGWHVDHSAHCGCREIYRDFADDVILVALEDLMLLDMDDDIEVSCPPAV